MFISREKRGIGKAGKSRTGGDGFCSILRGFTQEFELNGTVARSSKNNSFLFHLPIQENRASKSDQIGVERYFAWLFRSDQHTVD